MPSPSEKAILAQLKANLISRYGGVSLAAKELGVSRWGMRLAVLGSCPGVLKKMQEAGILSPHASGSVAANSSTGFGEVAIAANDRALTSDDWMQITPWGSFPNPQGTQRVTPKQGRDMVNALNALRNQQGNAFRGIPVYSGHPDVDPAHYKDDRRYGRIDALDCRDDGLYGKVAWNDLGAANKKNAFWIWPSAVWRFKRQPGGIIEPFELLSVGLTNNPVIRSVQPWTANAAPARVFSSTHGPIVGENSIVQATMPGVQVKEAALAYQDKHKCDWATAWNAQKKAPKFKAYFERRTVGANSEFQATTPGAAKREAKVALVEHQSVLDGFSAVRELSRHAGHLVREKGMGEHEAALQARVDHPKLAAAATEHFQAQERRKKLKEFTDAVHERMDRQRIDYASAWSAEKAARKQKNEWSPDNE